MMSTPQNAPTFDILIVGAGQAGAQVAMGLRQHAFQGTIAVVGDEPEMPYERPPLSKEYLAGDKPFERILIRPPAFWEERGITVLTSQRVCAVDPSAHTVSTQKGLTIGYGQLIWAAGGTPRMLNCSGADLAGVHAVRTRADVDALVRELPSVQNVAVVGGGYIGFEAAAVLRKLGKAVTVLEALPRVLARVAGQPLSDFYAAEHRAQGVDLRLGASVDCILGADGRATGVRLSDGEVVPAQIVIVGIGIVPSVEPLLAAGAAGANGVDVDAYARTSLPDIFAIGDCAAHENRFADSRRIRLESVQNANDMAQALAKGLTGAPEPYHAVPWFWSNQYDLRLQTAGLSIDHDDMIVRGTPFERSFSVVYLKDGRLRAVDCVNRVKDYVQGRGLIGSVVADRSALADPELPLAQAVAGPQPA